MKYFLLNSVNSLRPEGCLMYGTKCLEWRQNNSGNCSGCESEKLCQEFVKRTVDYTICILQSIGCTEKEIEGYIKELKSFVGLKKKRKKKNE
jgi:hypothetical protein